MIIYFSGTGNSRLAAWKLAQLTADEAVPIDFDADAMELHGRRDRIVWCFPTYSWGPPPVVADFISRVRLEADGIPHFMLTTCGDDMAYTDRRWRRLIEARGWQGAGAFAVAMPNTYVLMKGFDVDSPETAATKLSAMPAAIGRIAEAIGSGQPSDILIRGSWPWLKSYVIYPWFVRHAMSPRPFHHTAACTGCGGCARTCPLGNIAMDSDKRPVWGKRCALCLRCYHSCPGNAVAYGKATKGKGHYLAPKQ